MTNQYDTYRIYYQSTPRYYWQSRVYLYNTSGYAGRIMFIKEGNPIPENKLAGGQPELNFPTSCYEEIIAILRYEKPLYISLNEANGIGTISTSSEPVGEEEGEV